MHHRNITVAGFCAFLCWTPELSFLERKKPDISFSQKQPIWPQNTCQLFLCPSDVSWRSENSAAIQCRADIQLPPGVRQFQVVFLGSELSVMNDSHFPRYSWSHVVMLIATAWRFLTQRYLRTRRSCASNSRLQPWPIFLHSLNLFTLLYDSFVLYFRTLFQHVLRWIFFSVFYWFCSLIKTDKNFKKTVANEQ